LIVAFAGLALVWPVTSVSADPIDLTTWASSGSIAGDTGTGLVYHAGLAPTGSGAIQSFVRIAGGGSALVEEGYNTSGRPVSYDENTSPTFTHDLLLSDVPIVNLGGTNYYEFGLDINQFNSSPGLVLDDIRLYQSDTPSLTGPIDLDTRIWAMDTVANNGVELNFNADAGSGKGDMYLYLPTSLFDPLVTYVYLYSHFGGIASGDPVHQGLTLDTLTCLSYDTSGDISGASHPCGEWFNNDGYEEWFVRETTTVVPEPASLMLMGTGLIGIAGALRRRHSRRK
jgi:hypothetical protein